MRIISFFASFLIAILLFATAVAKLLHPWDMVAIIDRGGAVFEIFFASALLIFHQRSWMWLASSLVFAAWAGYSFFWTIQHLPCSCMGTLVEVPRGFFFGLDLVFCAGSLMLAYYMNRSKKEIYWYLLFSLVMGVMGFIFGRWVYEEYVLPNLFLLQ
jgi:hypothetical protein